MSAMVEIAATIAAQMIYVILIRVCMNYASIATLDSVFLLKMELHASIMHIVMVESV